jgi:hypothetical protein
MGRDVVMFGDKVFTPKSGDAIIGKTAENRYKEFLAEKRQREEEDRIAAEKWNNGGKERFAALKAASDACRKLSGR